jgi:hypothetical protein
MKKIPNSILDGHNNLVSFWNKLSAGKDLQYPEEENGRIPELVRKQSRRT